MGFWHKGAYTDSNFFAPFPASCKDPLCEFGDFQNIGHGLCRKACHEVKFYIAPSEFIGLGCRINEVMLCNSLVYYFSQSLAPCLRSQGKPGFPHPLYLFHNFRIKGSYSKRRERDRNILRHIAIHQGT